MKRKMIDPLEEYNKHIRSGLKYQRLSRFVLFTTIVLSTIGSSLAGIPHKWVTFIQSAIFVLIGAFNTINNVMGLAAKAEKHKLAASEYLIVAKMKEEGSDYVPLMTSILKSSPIPSP